MNHRVPFAKDVLGIVLLKLEFMVSSIMLNFALG